MHKYGSEARVAVDMALMSSFFNSMQMLKRFLMCYIVCVYIYIYIYIYILITFNIFQKPQEKDRAWASSLQAEATGWKIVRIERRKVLRYS